MVPENVAPAVPKTIDWSARPENASWSSLVRVKLTGAAPAAVAVTPYVPLVELAVAVTCAVPPAPMIAEAAESPAEAPAAGLTLNVTTPPATGSAGLLAETETASGWAKVVPGAALCGVEPATGVMVNPWLSKAPMSTVPFVTRGSPRWSVWTPAGIRALLPASIAGLPGSKAIVGVVPP